MKKIIAVAVILMSAQAVNADVLKKRDGERHNNNINPYGLTQVDTNAVNCDQLKELAIKKIVVNASGHLVAGKAENCLTLHDTRYDFFETRGSHILTRNGRCVVWSCEGRRDNGGTRGS